MKRLLGILLTAAMALTMPLSAAASVKAVASSSASEPETLQIRDVDASNFHKALANNGLNKLILLDDRSIRSGQLDELEVQSGSEVKIYLTAAMFTDSAGKNLVSKTVDQYRIATKEELRSGKITVKRTSSRGSKAFSSMSLKYDAKGSYISVNFVDPYTGVDELEFSTTLYLYVNGKQNRNSGITIAGTIANQVEEIYGDSEYVDLSGGVVGEAVERVGKVEIDLGDGLTITTSIAKGKKVHGSCDMDMSEEDYQLMEEYPEIIYVYNLSTTNMRKTGKVVSIDPGQKMYAYNAQGEYLDTTNNILAYSEKYYLSDKKYESLKIEE